jgi:hypothetical protein
MPMAKATIQNAIQNPGFENDTYWDARYNVVQGSYAMIQDDDYQYNGSYSGLTKTTNPKQECCVASLYQNLDVPVLNVSIFSYRIRKGASAPNGYYSAEVQIYLSGPYVLHYYHEINPQQSPMPSDTDTQKYINVGNLWRPNIFTLVSRDLYADLVSKFGYFIADLNITGIELFSRGSKNLYTGEKFGQAINWDHIYMNPDSPRAQISKYAVLICGVEGWPDSPNSHGGVNAINLAYTTLQELGYDHEHIYLVSSRSNHDADGDGESDLDASASVANVESSITGWLKGQSDPNDKCFIYVMAHGFCLQEPGGGEVLGGGIVVKDGPIYYDIRDNKMGSWIDQVIHGTMIFVIESCYSGNFINDVSSSDNTLVITSTTKDKLSLNDMEFDYPKTSWIPCFSYGFYQKVSQGYSLGDSFNAGWQRVQDQYGDSPDQYDPLLDDNGDGAGSEGLVPHQDDPQPRDGELALTIWP